MRKNLAIVIAVLFVVCIGNLSSVFALTTPVLVCNPIPLNSLVSYSKCGISCKLEGIFKTADELGLIHGKDFASVEQSNIPQTPGPTDADRIMCYMNGYIITIWTDKVYYSDVTNSAYVIQGAIFIEKVGDPSISYVADIISGTITTNLPLQTRYLNLKSDSDTTLTQIEFNSLQVKWRAY